jgi:hypothetical protein
MQLMGIVSLHPSTRQNQKTDPFDTSHRLAHQSRSFENAEAFLMCSHIANFVYWLHF